MKLQLVILFFTPKTTTTKTLKSNLNIEPIINYFLLMCKILRFFTIIVENCIFFI